MKWKHSTEVVRKFNPRECRAHNAIDLQDYVDCEKQYPGSEKFIIYAFAFLRKRNKMTQQDMANAMGCSRTHVCYIETGQYNQRCSRLPINYVIKMCRFFDMSVREMMFISHAMLRMNSPQVFSRDVARANSISYRASNLASLATKFMNDVRLKEEKDKKDWKDAWREYRDETG